MVSIILKSQQIKEALCEGKYLIAYRKTRTSTKHFVTHMRVCEMQKN